MTDEITRFNKERWEELARANVEYSRPFLDLDPASAHKLVDPFGLLGDPAGKEVLCLAGGGGQQSAAYALLGARVTVLDLTETQLQRDRQAAAHYGLQVRTVQGDMRDLSSFAPLSFDIVRHPFSINFVPQALQVFLQVQRVIRPGGIYHMDCANPFTAGIDEGSWDGTGYRISQPYVDGGEYSQVNPYWDIGGEDGSTQSILGPREFRHTLSTLINGLASLGFVILRFQEGPDSDPAAPPGSWGHFLRLAPLFMSFWTVYHE